MNLTMKTLLFSCVLASIFVSSSFAQTCKSYNSFSNNAVYSSCNDLPVLNSFLHWNYNESTNKVALAYRHTGITTSDWVAWAINPTAAGMVGSQALVAFQNSSGSMLAYTSPITAYRTSLAEGNLSFGVSDLSAVYASGQITIFATLTLNSTVTKVNIVWQNGPLSNDTPSIHSLTGANMMSTGTVDFLSGQTSASGGVPRLKRKNTHGVLNAVSWGVLLPMGVIFARYLKVFKSANPAWFYLHAACQTSAYIVGVAGWATGISLGNDSSVSHHKHRTLGILIFALGTLQVFALLLRPKPDHKYRFYWNIYHHSVGYLVIILSITNIYVGFDILDPKKKWKRAYTGVIIFLGACAIVLEAITWFIVIKRKREGADKYPRRVNEENGANGRTQHV